MHIFTHLVHVLVHSFCFITAQWPLVWKQVSLADYILLITIFICHHVVIHRLWSVRPQLIYGDYLTKNAQIWTKLFTVVLFSILQKHIDLEVKRPKFKVIKKNAPKIFVHHSTSTWHCTVIYELRHYWHYFVPSNFCKEIMWFNYKFWTRCLKYI